MASPRRDGHGSRPAPAPGHHRPLLETELQVLRLVAQGHDNREIAAALQWPPHAVSNRLRTIFDKLQVTNRTQAALYALRQGWASLDGGD